MIPVAKRSLTRLLHAIGLDVKWYVPRPPHALATLLELYRVEAIFDIGANTGSSGEYLRNIGFRGEIVSFEPVRSLYEQLKRKTQADARWRCENLALGNRDGELVMHVSALGGLFSSFLRMSDQVTERSPELRETRDERVAVSTLDAVIDRYYPQGDRLFLKLDVQGYEKHVLAGAERSIARVVGLRIEVAVVESYEGEPLMYEMLPFLYDLGYRLTAIEYAWSNPKTKELYQLDATLFRADKA